MSIKVGRFTHALGAICVGVIVNHIVENILKHSHDNSNSGADFASTISGVLAILAIIAGWFGSVRIERSIASSNLSEKTKNRTLKFLPVGYLIGYFIVYVIVYMIMES